MYNKVEAPRLKNDYVRIIAPGANYVLACAILLTLRKLLRSYVVTNTNTYVHRLID